MLALRKILGNEGVPIKSSPSGIFGYSVSSLYCSQPVTFAMFYSSSPGDILYFAFLATTISLCGYRRLSMCYIYLKSMGPVTITAVPLHQKMNILRRDDLLQG